MIYARATLLLGAIIVFAVSFNQTHKFLILYNVVDMFISTVLLIYDIRLQTAVSYVLSHYEDHGDPEEHKKMIFEIKSQILQNERSEIVLGSLMAVAHSHHDHDHEEEEKVDMSDVKSGLKQNVMDNLRNDSKAGT
jgi:hypothetical protein